MGSRKQGPMFPNHSWFRSTCDPKPSKISLPLPSLADPRGNWCESADDAQTKAPQWLWWTLKTKTPGANCFLKLIFWGVGRGVKGTSYLAGLLVYAFNLNTGEVETVVPWVWEDPVFQKQTNKQTKTTNKLLQPKSWPPECRCFHHLLLCLMWLFGVSDFNWSCPVRVESSYGKRGKDFEFLNVC